MKQSKFQSFFFKEVFGLKETHVLIKENIEYNQMEKKKLQDFIDEKLKGHSIITNETKMFYDKF